MLNQLFIDQTLLEVTAEHGRGGARTPSVVGYLQYRGEDTPTLGRLLPLLEDVETWNVESHVHAAVLVLLDQQKLHRVHRHGYEWLVPGSLADQDKSSGETELQWEKSGTRKIYNQWRENQ